MPLFCADRHKKTGILCPHAASPATANGRVFAFLLYRRRGMYKIIALFCAGKFALYGIYL